MSRRKSARMVLLAAASVSLVAGAAQASPLTWDGGGANQFFGTTDNWNPNQAPTSSDDVYFPALASAPAMTPLWEAADSVQSVSVDNSGGYVWQLARNGSVNPRSITLGSGGLSVTGGGSSTWSAVTTTASVAQDWTVGTNTVLTFGSGAGIAGGGKITKKGTGTLVLPNNSNSNSGGWDILAGTLSNSRSSGGTGTGTVSVYSGGTYLVTSTTAGSQVVVYNGGTLKGTGTSSIGTGITMDSAATAVTVSTGTSTSDAFTLNTSVSGGSASTVTSVNGSGTVVVNNAGSYLGSWRLESGKLQLINTGALGTRPLTLAGGTLWLAGGPNSAYTFDNTVTVDGTAAATLDKTGAAGTINERIIGSLVFNSGSLTVGLGSSINANPANTSTGNFGYTSLEQGAGRTVTLNANATFAVNNNGTLNASLTLNAISGGSNGITKQGTGRLWLLAANTYSGVTNVESGEVFMGNTGALGTTSSLNIRSSGQVTVNTNGTDAITLALPGDLTGDGILRVGNSGAATTTITGQKVISPTGNTAGTAAILDLQTKLTATSSSGNFPDLAIDIVSDNGTSNAVAGTDYDQLAVTGLVTGLNQIDLIVTVNPAATVLAGETLTILSSPGTNFTGQVFNSVTFATPGSSGIVNYQNGSVTLTNVAVPEPTGLVMLGMVGLPLLGRRRRRA